MSEGRDLSESEARFILECVQQAGLVAVLQGVSAACGLEAARLHQHGVADRDWRTAEGMLAIVSLDPAIVKIGRP